MIERGEQLAVEWQDAPRLAELVLTLGSGAEIVEARLTYLAGDADRFLVLRLMPDGSSQERPTLATLSLEPIPEGAVAQVPGFPDEALEPGELLDAAAAAMEPCLEGSPTQLLYTTGAPFAWDGERWTVMPEWEVSILAARDGPPRGAVVDVTSGAPRGDGCVSS